MRTILYFSILLHFYNTVHIQFYIKFPHKILIQKLLRKTFFRLSCNTFLLFWFHYTTFFGLYRPSSGVPVVVAKTVICVAIYPVKIHSFKNLFLILRWEFSLLEQFFTVIIIYSSGYFLTVHWCVLRISFDIRCWCCIQN
jgi:hypothetical protein